MYLTDYHTHSCCSPDSTARLEDMVRRHAGPASGSCAPTDHCDLQDENGAPLGGWDWTPILDQYWRARDKGGSEVKVLLGLELGGAYTDPGRAEALVAAAPLDFVIGSIHNLSPEAGGRDFFYLDYRSEEACYTTLDDYFASMLALTRLDCYDALGHIIYPLRYMNGRAGWHITLDRYGDQLDQLLRAVIQNGKAIEVNTHGGREVEVGAPSLDITISWGASWSLPALTPTPPEMWDAASPRLWPSFVKQDSIALPSIGSGGLNGSNYKNWRIFIMIAIASDHGGYNLKEHIKAYLVAKGISCQDFGTDSTAQL